MTSKIKSETHKNLAEQLRHEVLFSLINSPTFGKSLPKRSEYIFNKISQHSGSKNIKNAGEHLSSSFSLIKTKRGQKEVARAGVVWESLIVWYLNLCLIDTQAVCLKGSKFCPKAVKDALKLYIDNDPVGGEMDVLILSSKHFLAAPEDSRAALIRKIDQVAEDHFSNIGIINLQCKTSWADNAQAVMLYNMLYKQAFAGNASQNGFRVGKTPFTLDQVGHLGYAFSTVPTQKDLDDKFKRNSTSVLRVKCCTAGNYWGHPTKDGIARCISEIFDEFRKKPDVYPKASEAGEFSKKYFLGQKVEKIDGAKYFEYP